MRWKRLCLLTLINSLGNSCSPGAARCLVIANSSPTIPHVKEYKIVHCITTTKDGTASLQQQEDFLNSWAQKGFKFVRFLTWDRGAFWGLLERETAGDNPEVILLRQLLRAYGHEPEA